MPRPGGAAARADQGTAGAGFHRRSGRATCDTGDRDLAPEQDLTPTKRVRGNRHGNTRKKARTALATKKIRVYELARELGVENQVVLDLCERLKIGVKSHSSSIDDPLADRVRRLADAEGLRREPTVEEPVVEAPPPRSPPGP